ncbi:GNAT family N-acetyltransferase [Pseudonocardia xinjiangensis]|uniref:GNAT family N-acetyltransferase n=1 Tax=Pseudonocardia xinjiangensis TaxID=75289 RepID=A0ABX1RBV7_9PSEU|nr:GNAT family N-acetyltransferase [Pseudonocardia xinjiangensis]
MLPTVPGPLLHLTTPAEWRSALAAGAIAPASLADLGFVHLSTPEQVALPAGRLFRGRTDLVLLVLDPDRIVVPVRFEPGLPTDPPSMRFPHAYGPVPTAAVLAVLPYRPRPDGGFDAPELGPVGPGWRHGVLEPSVLRRTATAEVPVTGGVAVRTAAAPASPAHNQLLVNGRVDAAQVDADADRVLNGTAQRWALLSGAHLADTAAGLAGRGWEVQEMVGMAAPAGGEPVARVEQVDAEALRPLINASWRRDLPGIRDEEIAQAVDGRRLEEAVVDVRYLAVPAGGELVASAVLAIDGGTALLDAVSTEPEHRRRGHGDALLRTAMAMAAQAGCDLVVLNAAVDDWTRHWYTRRGFAEVGRSWSARLTT